MPHRKLQFSLLTVIIVVLVCAVGSGFGFPWSSKKQPPERRQPPEAYSHSIAAYYLEKPSDAEFQEAMVNEVTIRLREAGDSRRQACMFIAICDHRCHRTCTVGCGTNFDSSNLTLRASVGSFSDGDFIAAETTATEYDPLTDRILWNGQEMACPPNSALVARYDCDSGWQVTIDDGTFNLPELEPWLAEKLRHYHNRMREKIAEQNGATE